MYEEFTQDRIAQLRQQRNVSARDMSLSIGQNESYINRIENRKALPSLQTFFFICDYFGVTPQEFFDGGNSYPEQLQEAVKYLKKLDSVTLSQITEIIKKLAAPRLPGA